MTLAERLRQTTQEMSITGRTSGAIEVVPVCSTCAGRAKVYLPWVGELPCRDCNGTGLRAG